MDAETDAKTDIFLAKQIRTIAKLTRDENLALLCDSLERAANERNQEKQAEIRQLIISQQKHFLKSLPPLQLQRASIVAGKMMGEQLGNKLLGFLEGRRKRTRTPEKK